MSECSDRSGTWRPVRPLRLIDQGKRGITDQSSFSRAKSETLELVRHLETGQRPVICDMMIFGGSSAGHLTRALGHWSFTCLDHFRAYSCILNVYMNACIYLGLDGALGAQHHVLIFLFLVRLNLYDELMIFGTFGILTRHI